MLRFFRLTPTHAGDAPLRHSSADEAPHTLPACRQQLFTTQTKGPAR